MKYTKTHWRKKCWLFHIWDLTLPTLPYCRGVSMIPSSLTNKLSLQEIKLACNVLTPTQLIERDLDHSTKLNAHQKQAKERQFQWNKLRF